MGKCIVCKVHYSYEQFGLYCPFCKEEDKRLKLIVQEQACMISGPTISEETILSFLRTMGTPKSEALGRASQYLRQPSQASQGKGKPDSRKGS